MFMTHTITQIPTDTPSVYAFRIKTGVSPDEMSALADVISEAFALHGTIRMLLVLDDFGMSDALLSVSLKSLTTQARSIAHVSHYAVVGAPKLAELMIETFDTVSPIGARTFAPKEADEAWAFVGARPREATASRQTMSLGPSA